MMLVALVVFNVFDIYGRLLNFFGLSRFRFSQAFNDEKIDDGKTILNKGSKERIWSNINNFIAKRLRPSTDRESVGAEGRGSLNAKLMNPSNDATDYEDTPAPVYSSKKSFR